MLLALQNEKDAERLYTGIRTKISSHLTIFDILRYQYNSHNQMAMKGKSIRVTNRLGRIKGNQRKFINSLRNALFELGDLKTGSAIKLIIESVEVENELGRKAFQLIFISLLNACRNLIKANHADRLDEISNLSVKTNEFRLEAMEQVEEIELTADFFNNPAKHPLIRQFQPIFKQFLEEQIGISEEESIALSRSLPTDFWQCLREEWELHKEEFQSLFEYFHDNPLDKGWHSHLEKLSYYNEIRSHYQRPSMGDKRIKLSEIYIEPYFEVHNRCLPKEKWDNAEKRENFTILGDQRKLHEYINEYFLKRIPVFPSRSEEAQILLLLGQPGQGKTSFCYRLIYDLLRQGEPEKDLAFLRLRDVPNVREFINHPFQEIEKYFEAFSFNFKNILIVLDGLDELYMSEGITDNEINDFFYNLPRLLQQRQGTLLIITSRLNYISPEKIRENDALVFQIAPLTKGQQKNWLKIYSEFYPDCLLSNEMLDEVNDKSNEHLGHIRELINQPILLHLIAEARFDVLEGKNRAQIYTRLFDKLTDRDWDPRMQLEKFRRIDKEKFRDYIRFLAYQIHCSDYEFLLLSDVESMKETERFVKDNLNSNYTDLKDALKDVLITFYLKETDTQKLEQLVENRRDSAFEFFHKSLQEYLTAEHIYECLKDVFLSSSRRKEFQVEIWEDALNEIQGLFVDHPLTEYILDYLIEIIENDPNEPSKEMLLSRLEKFFPYLLQKGFLFEYLSIRCSTTPIQASLNGFYPYWHIMKALNQSKDYLHNISLPLRSKFELLIITERVHFKRQLILDGMGLDSINLEGARFDKVSFEKASLKRAIFDRSNLNGANLMKTNLDNASFLGTSLNGARLNKAHLKKTNFDQANLDEACLDEAHLDGVCLDETSLIEASLKEAKLINTNIIKANLDRAIFINAKLKGVNLTEASLSGAIFENAILEQVNFEMALLDEASLVKVDLIKTNFEEASLYYASLISVDFSQAMGLTTEQLLSAETLYKCKGLSNEIMKELETKKPELFEKPDWYDDDDKM